MQHCLNPSSLFSAGHKLKRVSRAGLKLVLRRRAVSGDFRYLCGARELSACIALHCIGIAGGKSVQRAREPRAIQRFYLIAVRLNFVVLYFNT